VVGLDLLRLRDGWLEMVIPKLTAVPITAKDYSMSAICMVPLGGCRSVDCRERTWRGVNHQRLPVDAIVNVLVLMSWIGIITEDVVVAKEGWIEGKKEGNDDTEM
jgi:hypothetical protein